MFHISLWGVFNEALHVLVLRHEPILRGYIIWIPTLVVNFMKVIFPQEKSSQCSPGRIQDTAKLVFHTSQSLRSFPPCPRERRPFSQPG